MACSLTSLSSAHVLRLFRFASLLLCCPLLTAQAPLATDAVQHPILPVAAVLAATVLPVYGDDVFVEDTGKPPAFLATLDASGNPTQIRPIDGLSLFWPAMLAALRQSRFDRKYAGRQVILTLPPPLYPDPDSYPLRLHHRWSEHELRSVTEQRNIKHQLPCDQRMPLEDLLRQARRLAEFAEDERGCYEFARKASPQSIAALWGSARTAQSEERRRVYFDAIIDLRPDFYEARIGRSLSDLKIQDDDTAAIRGLQAILDTSPPSSIQLQILPALIVSARKGKDDARELSLLNQLVGLELSASQMRPERYATYRITGEVYDLALRMDGAHRPEDAIRLLHWNLENAQREPTLYSAYLRMSFRLALAHALTSAGQNQEAANLCSAAAAETIPQREIEAESLGSRAVVESRKQLFCGEPVAGLARLSNELNGQVQGLEVHHILSDYALATHNMDDAARQHALWRPE